MSAWKYVVNFAIPPALVLTVLLVLPTPRVVKKGLLLFTRNVLFLRVVGNIQLVHLMMLLTGLALISSSATTYRLQQDTIDDQLSPNQRMAVLAKRWREERNFWIATLCFLLWSLLHRFYSLTLEHIETQDTIKLLQLRVQRSEAALRASGVPAPLVEEPSAPPADGEKAATGLRGRKKAA